jgi:hypothetical protein
MAKTYDNVSDELDAMIRGSHEYDTAEGADDLADNNEDTDHIEKDDTGSETNDEAAGLYNDTDEGTENDGEVNTLVDDGSLDGAEDDEDESKDGAKKDLTVAEDGTETDTTETGSEVKTTETIDYQKQYAELLEKSKAATEFYEKVAGVKFKANGKEVEGFKDPQKIIQAQQMAYNYSEKMAGFKQYRPYMGPLKDRGMLDDPSKFDLAMSLIDGDKEALKQHMANLGLDPMELDMETINYAAAPKTSSRDMIAIEDALDVARSHGVEDKIYSTVMKEWDDDSFKEFIGNKAVQNDLINQMASGDYDIVMNKVSSLSVLDDQFANMKMVDKYRVAITELNKEVAATQPVTPAKVEGTPSSVPQTTDADAKALAAAEAAKIAAKAVEDYKAKVNKARNEKAKAEREKATAASKPKSTTSTTSKHDPMALSGKEIADMLDRMMMGKK